MGQDVLADNLYDRIKPRLHKRIGRELRLAGRVLDFGCGACELVQYLARTYHQHVTGIDISGKSFPKRRHTSDGRRFRCIRKDARHLAFAKDGVNDAVISMWALHEMEHPEAILAEAYRALRPGGEILIIEFPRGSLAQTLWNEDYYSPAQINQMLTDAGFTEVRAKLIERKQILWAKGFRPAAVNGNT